MSETDILWKDQYEKIFIDWGDKAICYKWLHRKSHTSYSASYRMFTIPVIIMSTLTGTANFAQDRVPEEYRSMAQMIIGGINLFAGILTTISQFLKINELNESHRISAVLWDRFYRNIKIELCKDRKDRTKVIEFLKKCQDQYDSLMETSPDIHESVIKQFAKIATNDIVKPDICNVIVSSKHFLAPVMTDKFLMIKDVKEFIDNFIFHKTRFPLKDEIMDKFIDRFDEDDLDLLYSLEL